MKIIQQKMKILQQKMKILQQKMKILLLKNDFFSENDVFSDSMSPAGTGAGL